MSFCCSLSASISIQRLLRFYEECWDWGESSIKISIQRLLRFYAYSMGKKVSAQNFNTTLVKVLPEVWQISEAGELFQYNAC